jgi:hypothetical protein
MPSLSPVGCPPPSVTVLKAQIKRRDTPSFFNQSHPSKNQRLRFSESYEPRAPDPMDLVHSAIDAVHDFFFRKIIVKILESPLSSVFLQTPPELFQNYILTPVILCLGPCLSFYNYD